MDGFGGGVVQGEVFEGDAGYVVFLEDGEEGEAGFKVSGEVGGVGAREVAVLGWEGDAVVDGGDLGGGVGWARHCW